ELLRPGLGVVAAHRPDHDAQHHGQHRDQRDEQRYPVPGQPLPDRPARSGRPCLRRLVTLRPARTRGTTPPGLAARRDVPGLGWVATWRQTTRRVATWRQTTRRVAARRRVPTWRWITARPWRWMTARRLTMATGARLLGILRLPREPTGWHRHLGSWS